ncbi:MAG: hypothetical protein FWF94_03990 [Oscillospiraceae bacterium]|nr:hypothetical protein [Oscillospiraceae bacterium]
MRRIVFIVLAVIAAAIVAFFCWREFLVPEINFVADNTYSLSGNYFKVQRLYAAAVDMDAYNQELEYIMNTTEYTEEEIFAAAIASGKPEFFPVFNFGLHRDGNDIVLDGFIDVELAEGQTEQRFEMENVSIEAVVTQGDLIIRDIEVVKLDKNGDESVVKVNSEQQAAADISNAKLFKIIMDGEEGAVTLRIVYSVKANSLLSKTALEEQYLEIHTNITKDVAMNLEAEYISEPYSNLEELGVG